MRSQVVFLAAGGLFAARRRTLSKRSPVPCRAASRWSASIFRSRCAAVPAGFADPVAGPHCARHSGRDQRHGPLHGRNQPGQRALGQRGAVRRPHAPGAEPEVRRRLQGPAAGQVAAGRARAGRRRPAPARHAAARVRGKPQPRNAADQGPGFPPRHRQLGPRHRRPAEQPGGRGHPPAGPEPGRRIPQVHPAGRPAPPPRRVRLRHARCSR